MITPAKFKSFNNKSNISARSFNNQNLQNYPSIQIDRGSVIKPCVADQIAADQFLDSPKPGWRRMVSDIWQQGIIFILKHISNLNEPSNSNKYYCYFIKAVKYVALLMLHIHSVYLYLYGYFFPYSLMTLDEVCDEFSRCPKWSEAVIRAFSWHPNQDRCALAICNDYIYVYEGGTRIRVLRHNHQRKIVDLAWQPSSRDILVVATQTNIIIWRVIESGGPLNFRDTSRASNITYIVPRLQFISYEPKRPHVNGISKHSSMDITADGVNSLQHSSEHMFQILENVLPPPIISIQFDLSGDKLLACSPNSSKIAVIDMKKVLNSDVLLTDKNEKPIEYIRRMGQGVTRLLWSPEKTRLVTATTSTFFRVFEPFKWTCRKWPSQGSVIQDMVWSKPSGRMLLIANKEEACLYALPFLDTPQAGDVGGNKSIMKALDLSATRNELGGFVGGRVQSFAWDKNGKRLAISFKDNPESILLYRTTEKPTVEFHQIGILQSENSSTPLLMEFHDKFKDGSLLTICWSDGNCQHVPLKYPSEEPSSPPKTPRSLTSFCQVSGNKS